MCFNWLTDVIVPLTTSLIGGALALLGVKLTLNNENQAMKQERMEKVKPILINYTCAFDGEKDVMPKYRFTSDREDVGKHIKGIFKNTDCGIAFIDKIVTEKTIYFPETNSAVDKNTAFVVELHNLSNETLKSCQIFCHDLLGNKYYYDAKFVFDINKKSEIEIGNIYSISKKDH